MGSRLLRYINSYYRRFHPIVWMLMGGTAMEATGRYIVQPFLALYLNRTGTSLGVIGLVLAAGPLANLVIGLVGGSLADRWGRRPLLILGTVGGGLALIAFGMVSSPPAFALLNFLNTGFRSLYRPANFAALADLTQPAQRLEVWAIRRVAFNVGGVVGPVFGYWFYVHAPQAGFFAAGAVLLLLGLLVSVGIPETLPAGVAAASGPDARKPTRYLVEGERASWSAVLADRPLLVFVLATALSAGCHALFETYLPIAITARLPGWVFPAMFMMNAFMVIVLQIPTNVSVKRIRMGSAILVGGLLYAVAFVGFALAASTGLVILAALVFTAGELLRAAGESTFVPTLAPPHLRGRYEGMANLRDLGQVAGPVIFGQIMAAAGAGALFMIAAGVMVVAGLLGLWADRLAGDRMAPALVSGPVSAGATAPRDSAPGRHRGGGAGRFPHPGPGPS